MTDLAYCTRGIDGRATEARPVLNTFSATAAAISALTCLNKSIGYMNAVEGHDHPRHLKVHCRIRHRPYLANALQRWIGTSDIQPILGHQRSEGCSSDVEIVVGYCQSSGDNRSKTDTWKDISNRANNEESVEYRPLQGD
jgi:hypothetical protein